MYGDHTCSKNTSASAAPSVVVSWVDVDAVFDVNGGPGDVGMKLLSDVKFVVGIVAEAFIKHFNILVMCL